MTSRRVERKVPVPVPSRLRRYLLLELPAWLLVGVSVAYAIAAGAGGVGGFFQASLLVSAVAWLAGGRMASFAWGSVLFGAGLGTVALFNYLVAGFAGLPFGALLLPVTAYLAVVLVLLEVEASTRTRLLAAAGLVGSVVLQLLALSLLIRHT